MEHVIIAARAQRMLPTGTADERESATSALQAEVAELEHALDVLRFIDQSVEIDGRPSRGVS